MFPKYIHAFSPPKIPACTQSVFKLGRAMAGQGLETGSCLQGAPNPGGGCEEAFGVWVVLGLTPASVGLILPPWKIRALPHAVPHQSCTSCPCSSSQKPPSISPLALLVLPAVTGDAQVSQRPAKQRLWKREGHYLALVEGDL